MQDAQQDKVVAVVADLMFGSKIRAAAEQAGVPLVFVRSAGDLVGAAAGARVVLLDLATRWLDAPASIAALRNDPAAAGVRIIAFGSHVDAEALRAARDAGADRVLARSAFVVQLPELLRERGTAQ